MKKDVDVNVKLWSSDGYITVDDWETKDFSDHIEIIATITAEWEYIDLQLTFNATIKIDNIDYLNKDEVYSLSDFADDISYEYESCNLDPKNEYDAFRILDLSEDTVSLGYYINTDLKKHLDNKDLLDNFNKLFNTSTKEEVINKLKELDIDRAGMSLYENLYEDYDKNIVEKIYSYFHEYVQDNFEPHTGDGLGENIEKNIQIEFEFY